MKNENSTPAAPSEHPATTAAKEHLTARLAKAFEEIPAEIEGDFEKVVAWLKARL